MEKNGFVRVGWFLTDSCNLRCRHCYHDKFAQSIDISQQQQQLEKNIIDEIIHMSKSWDIETIGLLGGEPLLHPHIFDYIKVLTESLECNITIATNGLLIDDKVLDNIKKYPNLQIQISLDSSISNEHDFYRGTGTYEKTIDIIKRLVDNNIPPIIRMTVSDMNFDNIEYFVELGKKLKVEGVSINKYISDIRYPSDCLKVMTPVQHDEFLNKILSLKEKYGEEFVISEDSCLNDCNKQNILSAFSEELEENIPVGGCSAGLCNITIAKDGKVYPCTLLQLELGDLSEEHLVDIWESEKEVLKNLRDRVNSFKGKCSKCESLLICGGCRAAAYKMSEDYLAEDPFCNKQIEYGNNINDNLRTK